jgi:hypothetical protein
MIKTYAERRQLSDRIDINFIDGRETGDDSFGLAQPLVFERVKSGEYHGHRRPALSLRGTDAQQLMDQLWHCGLRPSEGTGSAGSLAATERHLADMKKIAFHALKVAP